MRKKVTMDDIAQRVGISKNAVSLALRGMPGISENMRSTIKDAANELGYKYTRAENTSEKQIQNICITVSMNIRRSADFYGYIQYGIEKEAKNNRMNCILFCHDDPNAEYLELPLCITEGMTAGVICIGEIPEEYIRTLQDQKIPVVLVDHYINTITCDCILTDNITGAFTSTTHLLELGHKEIGFWGDKHRTHSFFDRWLGYDKAMETYGLKPDPSFNIITVEELTNAEKLPSAFVCCNDVEAHTLIRVLSERGLHVPDDISVVGFDNIHPENSFLTTVHVKKEEMGMMAFQRLLCKLKNPGSIEQKILIPTLFVERNTTRSLK